MTAKMKAVRRIVPIALGALLLSLASGLPAGASTQRNGAAAISPGISAHAGATGSISGTVTDAVTSTGVAGICIDLEGANGGSGFGTTATLSDGTYSVGNLPAGPYNALVSPTCSKTKVSTYATVFDPNSFVIVVAGGATTGQNFALVQAGSISGTVSNAVSSAGLANVCIIAGPTSSGTGFATAVTTGSGSFTLSNLSPGSYALVVDPTCFGASASTYAMALSTGTGIAVVAGATTSGALFSLAQSGSVAGTVADAVTGAGIAGVCLTFGQSQGGSGFSTATTQSDGTYTATNLAPGTYDIDVSPSCNGPSSYVEEFQVGAASVIAGTTSSGENYKVTKSNLKVTTLSGRVGSPLTLRTLGGAGTGTVTFSVINGSAQGCSLKGNSLSATKAGTCLVTATKGPDVNNGSVSSPATAVTMEATPSSARPATVSLVFSSASSALSVGAKRSLLSLSNKLLSGASITVTGYAKGNSALALRRASAAANALKADTPGPLHVTLHVVTSVSQNAVTLVTTRN